MAVDDDRAEGELESREPSVEDLADLHFLRMHFKARGETPPGNVGGADEPGL